MKNFPANRVACLRQKFQQSIGLPFADILPEAEIEEALKAEGSSYRKRLFCPMITLWAWLSQVLDADKSCKKAVSRVVAYLVAAGHTPPSTDTSAYCKARKRIQAIFLLCLMRLIGKHLHEQPEPEWLWCGRRAVVFDGSRLTMADTEKNQAKYPQPKSQAKGCGFPAGRIVCGFSLSTGAVLDAVISSLSFGEVSLFRQLYVHLQAGDVALGDRMFGIFADICLLLARGVDSAFRMHGARKTDFRKGKRLALWDHIVQWIKPKQCPKGLKKKLYDQLPQRILLRETRFHIPKKGFRTEDVTLVTTLLDPKEYTRIDLAELYRLRWQAEIDLRHLKTTMQMEHLPSKTPEMVVKDFYVHLLAYNLIRTVQLEASNQHAVDPLSLSFCATIQQGKARDSSCNEVDFRYIPTLLHFIHVRRSTVASPPNRACDFHRTRLSSQILLVSTNPSNFLISHSSSTWQLSLSLIRVDPTYSTSPLSPLVFAFVTYGLYLRDRSVPTG